MSTKIIELTPENIDIEFVKISENEKAENQIIEDIGNIQRGIVDSYTIILRNVRVYNVIQKYEGCYDGKYTFCIQGKGIR